MKIKAILVLLLTILCCTLCSCEPELDRVTPVVDDTARFQYIGRSEITQNGNGEAGDVIQYYLDNETQIVYVVMVNRAGNGTWAGFTPLLDADGSYVTYEEFKNQK